MPSLFVIRGNDQGARWELEDLSQGIGRDPSNFVQLHDTEASRRHAEVRLIDKEYTIIDLSSSNGTYVNNRRIQQHKLESGDEVRIGSTVMLYKGFGDESHANLNDKIDIVAQHRPDDGSHIVQSISQKEGSSLFSAPPGKQSPWLTRAMSNLEVMYRTALAVSHTLDIDQLLSRIMQLIFEWVEADRGCILLVNNETKKLERKALRHRRGVDDKEKIRISNTIVEYVMKTGQGVLTSDAKDDSRWNPAASILQHNIREAICVPMQGRHNNMVGLIYIDTSTPPERIITHGSANKFTEEHLKLMIAIGHQAAMAAEDTRYYSELMQAERLAAVGQTIASLSHHIKNILQGIRGGSYVIEMGLADQEKAAQSETQDWEKMVNATAMIRKGWGMVEKNQNKISALVMDMLTFSKEREPALEPANLNQVVADVVELMESRAGDMGMSVEYYPAEEMPVLVFDPEGLHRAVLNVVTNALDACLNSDDRKGVVKVYTRFSAAEAVAQAIVEDNGVGIPPEEIEKIFILFNSSKKGGRGTGLGLSVSNKILHEHGGKIEVESEVGKGSRFILQLPAIFPEGSSDDMLPQDIRRTAGALDPEKPLNTKTAPIATPPANTTPPQPAATPAPSPLPLAPPATPPAAPPHVAPEVPNVLATDMQQPKVKSGSKLAQPTQISTKKKPKE